MLNLPVTTWTALINVVLFMLLTVSVILYRRRNGVVLGDNEDRVLTKRIRGQANAAEQMPLTLIVIGLCEVQGAAVWALVPLAVMFTLGRILHGAYFCLHGLPWRFRFYGMAGTLLGQIGLVVLLLTRAF